MKENLKNIQESIIDFFDDLYRDTIYKLFVYPFKKIYQKIKYGCADEDTWSLDITFAEYLLPRLLRLKQLKQGYPAEFKKPKDWGKILDKIILTFDMIADEDKYINWKLEDKALTKQWKQYDKTIEEGLKLFAKYFRALWW